MKTVHHRSLQQALLLSPHPCMVQETRTLVPTSSRTTGQHSRFCDCSHGPTPFLMILRHPRTSRHPRISWPLSRSIASSLTSHRMPIGLWLPKAQSSFVRTHHRRSWLCWSILRQCPMWRHISSSSPIRCRPTHQTHAHMRPITICLNRLNPQPDLEALANHHLLRLSQGYTALLFTALSMPATPRCTKNFSMPSAPQHGNT